MRARSVAWLVPLLATCGGCGGSVAGRSSATRSSCSDARFVAAVSPRVARLHAAVATIDAAHGEVGALAAAAPVLRSEADGTLGTALENPPCSRALLHARRLLLAAAQKLSGAARQLVFTVAAIRQAQPYAKRETLFLARFGPGRSDLLAARAAFRRAAASGQGDRLDLDQGARR